MRHTRSQGLITLGISEVEKRLIGIEIKLFIRKTITIIIIITNSIMDDKYEQIVIPLGGRLMHFLPFWKKITKDKNILDMITGLHIPLNDFQPQIHIPRNIVMNSEECKFVDEKIKELLNDKCIERTDYDVITQLRCMILRTWEQ